MMLAALEIEPNQPLADAQTGRLPPMLLLPPPSSSSSRSSANTPRRCATSSSHAIAVGSIPATSTTSWPSPHTACGPTGGVRTPAFAPRLVRPHRRQRGSRRPPLRLAEGAPTRDLRREVLTSNRSRPQTRAAPATTRTQIPSARRKFASWSSSCRRNNARSSGRMRSPAAATSPPKTSRANSTSRPAPSGSTASAPSTDSANSSPNTGSPRPTDHDRPEPRTPARARPCHHRRSGMTALSRPSSKRPQSQPPQAYGQGMLARARQHRQRSRQCSSSSCSSPRSSSCSRSLSRSSSIAKPRPGQVGARADAPRAGGSEPGDDPGRVRLELSRTRLSLAHRSISDSPTSNQPARPA